MTPDKEIIDLDAGRDRSTPGAVTVDRIARTAPDVVPWPFERDSFDVINR